MVSVCLTEEADCLSSLGRLNEAAALYEDSIERDKKRGDLHDVAVGKVQLSNVLSRQKQHDEAIRNLREARKIFESVVDIRNVAVSWNQTGVAYQAAGNFEEAEAAYQWSLAINVQRGDKFAEATTRHQLGTLYARMEGRREEALLFSLQAAEIYADPRLTIVSGKVVRGTTQRATLFFSSAMTRPEFS